VADDRRLGHDRCPNRALVLEISSPYRNVRNLKLIEHSRPNFFPADWILGAAPGIGSADIEELRRKGALDCDLIETLETVNTGNSFNLINGALNVGPDDFLSYMKGRGELWKKSA
jgi:hypothetical protein